MTKYKLVDHACETSMVGEWSEIVAEVVAVAENNIEYSDMSRTVSLHEFEFSLFNNDTGEEIHNAFVEIVITEPEVFLKIGNQ